ncbi:MAG: EamA family transporter RarD [Halobacteriovoraceae bacterium]|nr:EamA family transporter RarD [Halobacteriovoraceae bacterium]MCB9095495.1 EamA family transporter RarD [Halobacteriovoraceae bacterium]
MNVDETQKGYGYAVTSFFLWGMFPLFWRLLQAIDSIQLTCFRILLVTLTSLILIYIAAPNYSAFKKVFWISRQHFMRLMLSSFLIGINWFTFVYAVNSHQVIQASLGYFTSPLLSAFLGIFFLKEKLKNIQWISIFLFIMSLVILSWNLTTLPWIALSLASTFSIYGLIKKHIPFSPRLSLFYEALILSPLCLVYTFYYDGFSQLTNLPITTLIILVCGGPVSYLPLHFFSKAAQRIPLSVLGILQYIAPIFQFSTGRFVYGEPFSSRQLTAYSLVWLGIILFTTPQIISRLKPRKKTQTL